MASVPFNSVWRGGGAFLLGALCFGWASAAGAADIDGAWSSSVEACKKVFVKRGNAIQLSREADFYGSGFVIDGKVIRGKMATCRISSVKEEGQTLHLKATCATDISVSDTEFQLKIRDASTIVRSFPGIPELDTPYYRCRQ